MLLRRSSISRPVMTVGTMISAPAASMNSRSIQAFGRRHVPAASWESRQSASDPAGQHDIGDDRIALRAPQRCRKNCAPSPPMASRPAMAIVDRQIWVEQPAVAIEPVDIDHRRDDAPEISGPPPSSTNTGKRPMKPCPPCTRSTGPARISSPESRARAPPRAAPRCCGSRARWRVRCLRADTSARRRGRARRRCSCSWRFFGRTGSPPVPRSVPGLMSGSVDSVATRPRTSWMLPLMLPSSLARITLTWPSTSARMPCSIDFPVLVFGKQPGRQDDDQRERRRNIGRSRQKTQSRAKCVEPG